MQNWTYKNFTIHEFDELKSTNSHALDLANSRQIFDREIILAHSQTGGRGRMDRHWISPLGNLYFSIVLQPQVPLEKIPQISFVAAAALQTTVAKILNEGAVETKWPNDILIDQKKVAGILLESKISNQNCEFVVLGVGVNTASNPDQTIFPATNLKDHNLEIQPKILLQKFLDEFENLYQNWQNFGFKNIRNLWLKNAYKLESEIGLKLDNGEIRGIFEDLDEEGNLMLRNNNELIKICAADIFV